MTDKEKIAQFEKENEELKRELKTERDSHSDALDFHWDGRSSYEEMPPDAMQPHDTWIIAFCPDTDSFFVTNQRAFYWDSEEEFESEEAGIYFFEHQIQYFIDVEEKLMSDIFVNDWSTDCVFLENTNRQYLKNDI